MHVMNDLETPNITQATVIVLACLPELDGQMLLLKPPYALVAEQTVTEPEAASLSFWL